jgi:hypothetical protein
VHTGYCWRDLSERPLGAPRRSLKYNIKTDLQDVGGGRCELD